MATTMTERTNGERLWARHVKLLELAHARQDHAAEAILRSQSDSIAEKAREMDATDAMHETMRRRAVS